MTEEKRFQANNIEVITGKRVTGAGMCRYCGAEIYWLAKYSKGKPIPVDLDGELHLGRCPRVGEVRGTSDVPRGTIES